MQQQHSSCHPHSTTKGPKPNNHAPKYQITNLFSEYLPTGLGVWRLEWPVVEWESRRGRLGGGSCRRPGPLRSCVALPDCQLAAAAARCAPRALAGAGCHRGAAHPRPAPGRPHLVPSRVAPSPTAARLVSWLLARVPGQEGAPSQAQHR